MGGGAGATPRTGLAKPLLQEGAGFTWPSLHSEGLLATARPQGSKVSGARYAWQVMSSPEFPDSELSCGVRHAFGPR